MFPLYALTHQQISIMLLSLGLIIGLARLLGELAQRFRQPAVLGELLAGVILGPTVFGAIAPEWQTFLFPTDTANTTVHQGISTLAIVLFLLVAGLEVDLSTVWRQGRPALFVGMMGIVVPFVVGLIGAWLVPTVFGAKPNADRTVFALFFATAMSITALPVIAKTLMDLNLYRTDLGMIVISAAIFNDLLGWTIFALLLGMIGEQGATHSVAATVVMTLMFAGAMLTIGRWLADRALVWVQAYTHGPGAVLSLAITAGLCGAAFTEWIGIHAIFGSFIVGIALGASHHLHERTRMQIDEFVSFVFAPVFFGSIGLRVNFAQRFELQLVLIVLAVACLGKLTGGVLGARWGGLPIRDRWAIGFAMNARGAMEIILGLLALEAGLITQRLFVALVVMAIVTSAVSGPMMRWILQRRQTHRIVQYLNAWRFRREMVASTRREAISELVDLASAQSDLDAVAVKAAVWEREELLATGIGHGVAIPHARIDNLKEPIVAVGLCDSGIEFDAPDGQPAHIVFLLLTPRKDPAVQLELSANISQMFRDPHVLERLQRSQSFTEFLAVLKMHEPRPRS
jgi:Kef-type K+ transport system membrane component KefB/mannitol/fructose-specific phosphotransferase system IIA component (Ntr-type)